MCAVRIPADMVIGLRFSGAALSLNQIVVLPCSLFRIGPALLLKDQGTKAQTECNSFVLTDEKSSGCFLFATSAVRAHQYVTCPSHFLVHCNIARKKLRWETVVLEELHIPQTALFAVHGHVQHASDERHNEHLNQYHSYPISKSRDLPSAQKFAGRDGMCTGFDKSPAVLTNGSEPAKESSG